MNEHKPTSKRRAISATVRDEVLREAGYMCGNPRCRNILTLDIHHIVAVKDGGGNDPTNLLALCPTCHEMYNRQYISSVAIRQWKGLLHALNYAFSKESMDLLLFLHRHQDVIVWYSGDGLLRFAPLLAAGLARIADTHIALGVGYGGADGIATMTTPPSTAHRVELSDAGNALVEAWLLGDEAAYRELLRTHAPRPPDAANK